MNITELKEEMKENEQKVARPVCLWTPVESFWFDHKKDVDCPVCGQFVISGNLNERLWTERKAGRLEQTCRFC